MSKVCFRLARIEDADKFLDIYEPFVNNTEVTFDFKINREIFQDRIKTVLKQYPWIVCEIDGNVVGYAYASYFKEREGYTWTAEQSVYVNEKFRRCHIATALYICLRDILSLQGYYNIVVIIANTNMDSVNFHKNFGFKEVGVIPNAGFKLGKWYDRMMLSYSLRKHDKTPQKPKPITKIIASNEYKEILKKCENIILSNATFV